MKISIRNAIIVFNAVLISVTGAVILIIYTGGTNDSIYLLAKNLMSEITKSAVAKTEGYLLPAERANRQMAFHYSNSKLGAFRQDNSLALDYMKSILDGNPEFNMVYFADISGNLLMQKRMADGSFSKRLVKAEGGKIRIQWEHSNSSYYSEFFNTTESASSGYDPRKRVWYKAALEKKGIAWTDVYVFASERVPGFSNVIPVYNNSGSLFGVCSIDIGIIDLSYFLKTLSITPNAKTIITDTKMNILGLPLSKNGNSDDVVKKEGKETLLKSIRDLSDPVYLSAYSEWFKSKSENPFRINVNGNDYFAMFTRVAPEHGLDLIFGVMIPDDDLTGIIKAKQRIVISICIIMVIIAVLLSFFLSRAISKPIQALMDEMDKVKGFDIESGIAIPTIISEIENITNSFESMKTGLKNFQKYVPSDLVAQLLQYEKEASIGGDHKTLTVFFSDIKDFTSISEKKAPDNLVSELCDYFSELSNIIVDNSGTVDKYIGDSIMAFWGAPRDLTDHAVQACRTALMIQSRLKELNTVWENRGRSSYPTRIGLNTGDVIVGNMGYEKRFNYTVIGDNVNVASRIEGLNKYYGTKILISESTRLLVKEFFALRVVDEVAVKGKKESFKVYELIAEIDSLPVEKKKVYDNYERGLDHYFNREFTEAVSWFDMVIKQKPGDGPSAVMKKRCEAFIKKPPVADWDGVFRMDKK